MKVSVYKDRDSKEFKLYESCVFDSKEYNPNFICHIDLPIEKPKDKEIRKVAVLQKSHLDRETVLMFKDEYLDNQGAFADHFYLGDVEYHPSMILTYKHKPKKKLVTKEAITLVKSWGNFGDPDAERYTFKLPVGAKNVHCTYEVEE